MGFIPASDLYDVPTRTSFPHPVEQIEALHGSESL